MKRRCFLTKASNLEYMSSSMAMTFSGGKVWLMVVKPAKTKGEREKESVSAKKEKSERRGKRLTNNV